MKIIFNDATELQVQKVEQKGDYLRVLTVSATPEQLRRIFEDIVKTATMVVEERGQKGEPLVGYTTFYRTEEYPGKIYGIVQYRPERTPEAQTEVQEAAIIMAKIQAESLPEEQALQVKALYDSWSGDGVAYKTGKYLTYKDILYKVLQNHTSQTDWTPDTASSLYAKVLTDPSGKVLPWEQPQSTNPYKKGDRVTHKGKTWESLVDSNVWEPGAVGTESLWKEV
jgi:hypothetical protein|nr:MAG TPA: ChiA1-BD-binding domain protein [Caudoviricetes sp.]